MREDSRLPQAKHQVPPSDNARPSSTPLSFQWPLICGANSSTMPASPNSAPTVTWPRIGRPRNRRPASAIHSGAVENTTASWPLVM